MTHPRATSTLICLLSTLVAALPLAAVVEPEASAIRDKTFRDPDLVIIERFVPGAEAPAHGASRAMADLGALGVAPDLAYLDLRSRRWATLMPVQPLLPGTGAGNELTWESLELDPPRSPAEHRDLAWGALTGYLRDHQDALRIDVAELRDPGNVMVHEGGGLVQIHAPRRVGGVDVRDSFLTAVIRHGNLILFGARNWGDVTTSSVPTIPADQAIAAAQSHLGSITASAWRKSELAFVPVAAPGDGVAFRLVWVLHPGIDGDLGTWEALVDAHSGELLSFQDLNQYASTRELEGGVFPQTNDGIGPEGMEQPDYAMPFMDLINAGDTLFTDSGGNLLACVDGTITTELAGRFVRMNDNCGAINESTAGDVLDLGISGGTDCVVPASASAGNTHASRTGSYELNRIIEMARGHLPNNGWLQDQLTANMNIPLTCNAFWNGSTVNFYRRGGGCNNTGELAGIFDHEWGHGMDSNDGNSAGSNPGEAIADVYATLRLNTPCIGRGFSGICGGYGDPCIGAPACTGVRDMDWANHTSLAPHTVANYTLTNSGPPNGGCQGFGTQFGPCGGEIHCEGVVPGEAIYDLIHRDLPAAPFTEFDWSNEIVSRLMFLANGAITNWHTCSGAGSDGCAAGGGYLNVLAVDDDGDGLGNGTPHMSAIFGAFDRHGIACAAPAPVDSGCPVLPAAAPVVSATALDRGAHLTWPAVIGASKYKVFRTEGVFGCDVGKVFVGETTGTEFVDEGLKNGTDAFYVVAPIGTATGGPAFDDTCIGPTSSCTTVTPTAGANLAATSGGHQFLSGDGDAFLDNCEQARLTVAVANVGTGNQANVRIADVRPVGQPGFTVLSVFPLAVDNNLTVCETSAVTIDFQAGGLALGKGRVEFEVDLTSDQLSPLVRTRTVRLAVPGTESDFQNFASRTFSFEVDGEDWKLVEGTFDRVTTGSGSGGNGTDFYRASSGFLPDQCDHIRSPVLSLNSGSAMTMWTNFNIEDDAGGTGVWYDRANVGLYDVVAEERSLAEPSSGRDYNATGDNGTCGTTGQRGWAGTMQTWASTIFDATAMSTAAGSGQFFQLDVRHGTDSGLHLDGFWFDEVTVTNVDVQVADAQSDVCAGIGVIFADGFESGDTTAW